MTVAHLIGVGEAAAELRRQAVDRFGAERAAELEARLVERAGPLALVTETAAELPKAASRLPDGKAFPGPGAATGNGTCDGQARPGPRRRWSAASPPGGTGNRSWARGSGIALPLGATNPASSDERHAGWKVIPRSECQ